MAVQGYSSREDVLIDVLEKPESTTKEATPKKWRNRWLCDCHGKHDGRYLFDTEAQASDAARRSIDFFKEIGHTVIWLGAFEVDE